MAMEINATLVVQAFNFFITYLLLRLLFFKPAFKALNQERDEKEGLESIIAQREERLVQTAEEKKQSWQKLKKLFAQASPPVRRARVVHSDVEPAKDPKLPGDLELDKLAYDVQEAVVKKVQHVE